MSVKKIVVDASVIADHLMTAGDRSMLRQLSNEYFCYTTVFSAIELFACCRSLKETQAVQAAMDALKVLGVAPKSAKNIAAVVSSSVTGGSAALAAGICRESKLPMVTLRPERYRGIRGVTVLSAAALTAGQEFSTHTQLKKR